ncbi:unnamed protein product, partial [Urochloa humidicola]
FFLSTPSRRRRPPLSPICAAALSGCQRHHGRGADLPHHPSAKHHRPICSTSGCPICPQAQGATAPKAPAAAIDAELWHGHGRRGASRRQAHKEEALPPPRDPSLATACKVRVPAAGAIPLQPSSVTPEAGSLVTLSAFSAPLPTSSASPALSASSPIAPFSTMSVAQEVLVEMPESLGSTNHRRVLHGRLWWQW